MEELVTYFIIQLLKELRVNKKVKQKVKQSAPLQAWSGPEGSRKLRFPDSMTTAQIEVKYKC
jgi:hypothetical protein